MVSQLPFRQTTSWLSVDQCSSDMQLNYALLNQRPSSMSSPDLAGQRACYLPLWRSVIRLSVIARLMTSVMPPFDLQVGDDVFEVVLHLGLGEVWRRGNLDWMRCNVRFQQTMRLIEFSSKPEQMFSRWNDTGSHPIPKDCREDETEDAGDNKRVGLCDEIWRQSLRYW